MKRSIWRVWFQQSHSNGEVLMLTDDCMVNRERLSVHTSPNSNCNNCFAIFWDWGLFNASWRRTGKYVQTGFILLSWSPGAPSQWDAGGGCSEAFPQWAHMRLGSQVHGSKQPLGMFKLFKLQGFNVGPIKESNANRNEAACHATDSR